MLYLLFEFETGSYFPKDVVGYSRKIRHLGCNKSKQTYTTLLHTLALSIVHFVSEATSV